MGHLEMNLSARKQCQGGARNLNENGAIRWAEPQFTEQVAEFE